MTKSYCLKIAVKSGHIENGLHYMIAFRLADEALSPQDLPDFWRWQEEVKVIVTRAGDHCLDVNAYTRKLAIAGMMHDLSKLNDRYGGILIASDPPAPAVQVQSTHPHDPVIEIDFSGTTGQYRVREKKLSEIRDPASLAIEAQKNFPPEKTVPAPARREKPLPPSGPTP